MHLRRALGLAALACCLAACDKTLPPTAGTLASEASYRLLFNDALVGEALFTLQLDSDGGYRIEAFSVPAGKLQRAEGHEILESSHGTVDGAAIRPRHFRHSVRDQQEITELNLAFDWDGRKLALSRDGETRTLALLPDTHDRLSYLLAAHRLAVAGSGRVALQVAGPNGAEATVLEIAAATEIELPSGRHAAVEVRRATASAHEHRALWYALGACALPARIRHENDGNVVEMRLQRCVEAPVPAAVGKTAGTIGAP